MKVYKRTEEASDIFAVLGSFGELCQAPLKTDFGFLSENEKIKLSAEIKEHKYGVFTRRDAITNISECEEKIYSLGSRFSLDGGDWEVYTQYNGWQNESIGAWAPLVTSIVSRCNSVRGSHDAAPILALWNKQNDRGVVFHLKVSGAWQMRASRVYSGLGTPSHTEIEIGLLPDGLSLPIAPGETLNAPEIIYYEFKNKKDLDAYKLHSYINEKYPARALPVVFDSWLYKFDKFNFSDMEAQLERAKEIGVEYFVIDAGWFGKTKDWYDGRGDWCENLEIGFEGRMQEFAELVRSRGMKFGFWLEPECAGDFAEVLSAHPEYFLRGKNSYFLDFLNDEAFDYILKTVTELIEKYGAEYIKLDFNADLEYDKYSSSFTKYQEAHDRFILKIREKFPEIYLENCGSGGACMNLHTASLYDSFWPTDNESPYVGLRIYKDTLLRMPPRLIECWCALASVTDKTPVYGCSSDKIISCADAVWDHVVGVSPEYLRAYLSGSPIGLSFDLNSLSEGSFDSLKSIIEDFKNRRDFYASALCHVLTDSGNVTALEYRSEDFSECEICVFTDKIMQDSVTVYPVVDEAFDYVKDDGSILDGKELSEYGIDFALKKSFSAYSLKLRAVRK